MNRYIMDYNQWEISFKYLWMVFTKRYSFTSSSWGVVAGVAGDVGWGGGKIL